MGSAQIWPPISDEDLKRELEATKAAELEWLLDELQVTLGSLKSGLEECVALLAPQGPGSTLAMSSVRSESVKGFVTRVGTRIVKGDIALRLATLAPPRSLPTYPMHIQNPLSIPQLTTLLTLLNQSLDIIDISTWTGDARDGSFIGGQLRLLADSIDEARLTLKGGEELPGGKWWDPREDDDVYSPPHPPTLSTHLAIIDAALVLWVRTLFAANEDNTSISGLSLRQRLGLAPKLPEHDEVDKIFIFKGQEVRVREKVKVESQDPALMAVMAKLSALGHAVAVARNNLSTVMEVDAKIGR